MTGGIVVASWLAWCGNLLAEPEVAQVRLSEPAQDWEVDPSSGRTFVLLQAARVVVEYNAEGKEVRRFVVGPNATEMELKGRCLAVLCPHPQMIYLLDLDENEPIQGAKVNGPQPRALFASRADNSYLYYLSLHSARDAASRGTAQVMRIDLEDEERKSIPVEGAISHDMVGVAMSPDGRWFIPYRRGGLASVSHLYALDEATGKLETQSVSRGETGEVVPCPSSRGWLLAGRLYSIDGAKERRDFQGRLVGVHPKRDVAAVWNGREVVLKRYSDAAEIETLPDMPGGAVPATLFQAVPAASTDPVMRFDVESNRLFVGYSQVGYWVTPETKFAELPPHRWIDVPERVAGTIGEPIRLEPKIKSALETQDDDSLTIRLKENSFKVECRDGKVEWTPLPSRIGGAQLEFELWSEAENRVVDTAACQVEVNFPAIELDFAGEEIVASPDGRHLLVQGPVVIDPRRHPNASGVFGLAVIDRETSQVVGQMTIDGRVRCYAIDNDAIYVVTTTSSAVTQYNFRMEDEGIYLPTDFPDRLVLLPGQKMAVVPAAPNRGQGWSIVDVKSMKLVEEIVPMEGQPFRLPPTPIDGERVLIDGGLVDLETGRMTLLTNFLPLPALTPGRYPAGIVRSPGEFLQGRRWGVKLGARELKTAGEEHLFSWQDELGNVMLLKGAPGVAMMHRTVGTGAQRGAELEIRNLFDGQVEYTCPIYLSSDGLEVLPGERTFGQTRRMVEIGDELVLLLNGRIVSIPLPMEKLKTLRRPPQFAWEQPLTVEIEPYGASRVTPKVLDVEEGTRFAQLLPTAGVVIHPVTGELTVASGELWKNFVSPPTRAGGQRPLPMLPTETKAFDVKENEAIYRRLTGSDLPKEKFAVWIPVYLQLTSPSGHVDRLPWSLILLGPRKDVEVELARRLEQEREREEARQRAQAEVDRQRRQMQQPPGRGAEDEETMARLQRLEQRVTRLEELLQKLVRERDEQKEE